MCDKLCKVGPPRPSSLAMRSRDESARPLHSPTAMDLDRTHGDDHHTEAAHAELSRLPYRMPSRSVADRVPISTIMTAHAKAARESLATEPIAAHAIALKEDSSVSAAAATMAREGLERVRVVCSLGKLVGVVSALDIMRWLAEQDGYNARK